MKIQRTIRKTFVVAVHIAVAKCAMYGDFDYFNGDGYNNACGGYARPQQTLDDAYYYGDYERVGADAAQLGMGGCNAGGCGISQDTPAIGFGAYPTEETFPMHQNTYVNNSFPEQAIHNQMGYQPERYDMSTAYFNNVENVNSGYEGSFSQNFAPVAPVAQSFAPVAQTGHAATCIHSAGVNAGVSAEETEPITILLNGSVPVNMQPTTITLGDQTYPLSNPPAISASVSQLGLGAASIQDLDLTSATIVPLPSLSKEEAEAAAAATAAGITVAQLKKDQKDQDAPCKTKKSGKKSKKSGKKGAASAAALKKKNGVAGVSTVVAIAVLPIIALLM
ncbi:hypothetical protein NEAUS07_0887 [Nematocida ausubeli]|nr:hypothetical protein NEAUS07_0887 [Nematocida ausubeli]